MEDWKGFLSDLVAGLCEGAELVVWVVMDSVPVHDRGPTISGGEVMFVDGNFDLGGKRKNAQIVLGVAMSGDESKGWLLKVCWF